MRCGYVRERRLIGGMRNSGGGDASMEMEDAEADGTYMGGRRGWLVPPQPAKEWTLVSACQHPP